MKRLILLTLFSFIGLSLAQAGGGKSKWDYLVTIHTSKGDMKVILYDETPQHKANFLKLIKEGFYDSLTFHRVIENFMIQGGDPGSKLGNKNPGRLGRGGPGYKVPAEFRSHLFHRKGALAAARQSDFANPKKASSGSQFYVVQGEKIEEDQLVPVHKQIMRDVFRKLKPGTPLSDSLRKASAQGREFLEKKVVALADQIEEATGFKVVLPQERIDVYTTLGGTPFLDDQYTVFGEVIMGLEVIDEIASVKTGRGDVPSEPVWMYITAERIKKKKITKTYGYSYEKESLSN